MLACIALAAFLVVLAWWKVGPTPSLPAYLAFALISAVLAVIDLHDKRLPNPLPLAAYPVIGLLLLLPAASLGQWGAYGRAWASAAILVAIYAVLALASPAGLGMGDVKLAGSIGLILGWQSWTAPLWGTALGFILGGIVSAALLATGRAGRRTEIPFGPSMLLAAWILICW